LEIVGNDPLEAPRIFIIIATITPVTHNSKKTVQSNYAGAGDQAAESMVKIY